MKTPAPKLLFLFVTLAAIILVGGGLMVRRYRSRLPAQIQFPRYAHQHLRSSEWENAKLHDNSYTLREGETLAGVAKSRYGHQHYSSIIKVYNHIDNEVFVKAGTTLRLPDISTILAEEGVTKVAGTETEMILCSRAKYDRVASQLWDLRKDRPNRDRVIVPEKIRQELFEAADDLQQATEGLKTKKPGVIQAPEKTIRQLEQVMSGMRELASGANDGYGYDIDMVQQRYALALTYAIIWAREGFN